MVRGSRFIPALFGEVKVSAVRQVKNPEKEPHEAVTKGYWLDQARIRNAAGEEQTATQNKSPSKNSHAPRHKETGGMKCTAIKDNPCLRQPKHCYHAGDLVALCQRLF